MTSMVPQLYSGDGLEAKHVTGKNRSVCGSVTSEEQDIAGPLTVLPVPADFNMHWCADVGCLVHAIAEENQVLI